MKVGLVLPSFPSYSETFFYSKIKGLQESGIDVVVFSSGNTNGFDLCEYKILPGQKNRILIILSSLIYLLKGIVISPVRVLSFISLERKSGRNFLTALKNTALNMPILISEIDWLHFGFTTMSIGRENLAGAIKARSATSFRGFDICIYPLKHPNAYHLLWQRLDKVHTISDDLLHQAYDLGLSPETPIEKITPAIDIQRFYNVPRTFDNKKTWSIITVARLHWKKGIEDTLQGLSLLKKEGVEFKYSIIGDGTELERLKFAVHQFGLNNEVVFFGKRSHKEVIQMLKESDICIQYSISEGFCNAILEAQAMNLLCVVSNAEGLPENILDGKTGWVVSKYDPEKLKNTLLKIVNSTPEKLHRITHNARERIEQKFNLEQQKNKFKEFYLN
ncbi:glycosyltransferase family 4 protein [bacterium]|nr:glycosyltransferase family 4 protein [bacterium]